MNELEKIRELERIWDEKGVRKDLELERIHDFNQRITGRVAKAAPGERRQRRIRGRVAKAAPGERWQRGSG